MALLKRNTGAALEAAQQDLAAVEQTIADLRIERETMLPDGEVSEIEKLDRSIADHERQVAVYLDKLPLLQARLATEQAEAKRRQRAADIERAEPILTRRQSAVFEVARWLKSGSELLAKLEAASRLRDWPEGLEKPYAEDVRTERFLAALSRALAVLSTDPQQADAIISDAVAIEGECSRGAMDDLRLNPAPANPVEVAA
jgi:chromosome segregation ATPase